MLKDLSGLKRVKLIDEIGDFINVNNPLTVQTIDFRKIKWTSNTDFDAGSLTNIERKEIGDNAYIQLGENADNNDNIDFENSGDYTLSDGTKLEIVDGNIRLKPSSGTSQNYPFTTPANYMVSDVDLIEVTSGVAKLIPIADLTTNCESFWKLNETSGTREDSIGSNDLTSSGAVDSAIGSVGNAANFDNAADQLFITDNASLSFGNEDMSLSFWVYLNTASTSSHIIGKWGTGGLEYAVYLPSSGGPRFIITHNGASQQFVTSTPALSTSAWHHIVAWHDSVANTINIQVDNGTIYTTAHSLGLYNGTKAFTLGNDSTLGTNFRGRIDSVGVWRRVLTSDERLYLYNSGNGTESLLEYPIEIPYILNNTGFIFSNPVTTFEESSTKPVGTEIKYQISDDDGTTWKYWDGDSWEEITDSNTEIVPSSISTSVGTVDAGDITSIQTLDGLTYDVSEVIGVPGFTTQIDWTNIPKPPTEITLHVGYDGTLGHTINVDIYNWQTLGWDNLGTIPETSGVINEQNYTVTGTPSDYLSGSNEVRIRIRHPSSGNAFHNIYYDYCYLLLTENPDNDWWYDNESNLASEVNTDVNSLAVSGTFKFRAFLNSDSSGTPELDNILVSGNITYSTDDNLYADTSDNSQIPVQILYAWVSAIFTNSIPANTDIKILFSVDSRINWLTWDGNDWITPIDATQRQYATSLTDASTNFPTLDVGNSTLDVRVFLKTDDNAFTPFLSNINVISDTGYAISGTFESQEYDSGYYGLEWGTIEYELVQPTGLTIIIKARAGNNSGNLGNYGTALSNNTETNLTGRYIQWQATFSSTEPLQTCKLLSLIFNFVLPLRREVRP